MSTERLAAAEAAADAGLRPSGLTPAVVTYVVDGDTARVRVEGSGAEEKVRFIGVDTPENTLVVEPFGMESSAYARKVLSGQTVYLETDAGLRDSHGRLLAYLWMNKPDHVDEDGIPDGAEAEEKMFNAWLVRDGYAQVMTVPPNVKYASEFLRLQREAREAKKGLWNLPELHQPLDASTSDEREEESYVGNKSSRKFHRSGCIAVIEMKPENNVALASVDDALSYGYVPCGVCRP